MNKNAKGLGKGLGALLGNPQTINSRNQNIENAAQDERKGIDAIAIELIKPNANQPRTEFDEEQLSELAQSIEFLGVIQPITVREISPDRFELISGERRWRASKMAGLTHIPAYIRKTDDDEMLQLALVENIQRQNLNSIEVAISYQRLIDECNVTQEELSKRVGKNRTTISNYLRLLKLPAEIQYALKVDKISMGHARALLAVEDSKKRLHIFESILKNDLSVRKVEELAKLTEKPNPTKKKAVNEKFVDIQKTISNVLNTKALVKRNVNGKGAISIAFRSDEHLEEILNKLNLK